MPESIIYLVKDNNDLCCFCTCDEALISSPGQLDCPWCGCGWLFSCIKCRKAFCFARAKEWHGSWEDLAQQDLKIILGRSPTNDDVVEWVTFMKDSLKDIEVGNQYIYLDGSVIATDSKEIEFDGWHSRHKLDFIPQVAALENRSFIEDLLIDSEYWISTQIQYEDD